MTKTTNNQPIIIPASSFQFLKILKANNNRDWFNANKNKYLSELAHIEDFAEAVLTRLNATDMIETPSGKKSLHRIYRDVRFSKEKTPYKTNWSGSLNEPLNSVEAVIIFILSLEIVLLPEVFGHQTLKI